MDLLKSISHPDEVVALMRYKLGSCASVQSKCDKESMSDDLKTCYEFLSFTSRSFSAVIQALDGELRNAVCLFYLVLRALDTVEDDMTIPINVKIPMLTSFHTNLWKPDWNYTKSSEKDRIVLEKFPVISAEFRKLEPMYQTVIEDICKQMGHGMTVFLEKHPTTVKDWNEYCHYVAGLVGIGLSQLFSASGLESKIIGEDTNLANSMGLFLQKTNIIRDYLEDINEDRMFWPKEIWRKYAHTLADLKKPEKTTDAVACLNELITNALQHVPDVLLYMSRIQNQSVFNFCAIPQVMAIATLERCYNNHGVFTSVVKIRKGEAVQMMMKATSLDSVKAIMHHFASQIEKRIPASDPSTANTKQVINKAMQLSTTPQSFKDSSVTFFPIYVSCTMLVVAILWQYWTNITSVYDSFFMDDR